MNEFEVYGPALEEFVFVGKCCFVNGRKLMQGAKIKRDSLVEMSEEDYKRNAYYFVGMHADAEDSDDVYIEEPTPDEEPTLLSDD